MAGKVITKLAISNNTYIASIAKNMNTRKLKKLNVRAVLALSPEMKISPMVLQLDKEIVKVNIITSNDIKDIVVSDVLEEQHGAKLQLKFRADSVNKYTYSVQKSKLTEIAKLPWILQINEGGMR